MFEDAFADDGFVDDFADGFVDDGAGLAAAGDDDATCFAASGALAGAAAFDARNSFEAAGGSIAVGESSAFGGRVDSGCERFSCCQRGRVGSDLAAPGSGGGARTVTGFNPAAAATGCAAGVRGIAGCGTALDGGMGCAVGCIISGCGDPGGIVAGAAKSGGYSIDG